MKIKVTTRLNISTKAKLPMFCSMFAKSCPVSVSPNDLTSNND